MLCCVWWHSKALRGHSSIVSLGPSVARPKEPKTEGLRALFGFGGGAASPLPTSYGPLVGASPVGPGVKPQLPRVLMLFVFSDDRTLLLVFQ